MSRIRKHETVELVENNCLAFTAQVMITQNDTLTTSRKKLHKVFLRIIAIPRLIASLEQSPPFDGNI